MSFCSSLCSFRTSSVEGCSAFSRALNNSRSFLSKAVRLLEMKFTGLFTRWVIPVTMPLSSLMRSFWKERMLRRLSSSINSFNSMFRRSRLAEYCTVRR